MIAETQGQKERTDLDSDTNHLGEQAPNPRLFHLVCRRHSQMASVCPQLDP